MDRDGTKQLHYTPLHLAKEQIERTLNTEKPSVTGIPFTFENPPFRVRRFYWRARREGAGLVRYFKPLQQRPSVKNAYYKRGVLERGRYI
ncbi:MAG: hypothetical protein DSZ28_07285 [Thiothrix sp.]|nr:MAG: hypothetical protein DSZ28_07285 [Thiothrix sp.]